MPIFLMQDIAGFSTPETFFRALGKHQRLTDFYQIWASARTGRNLVPRKSDLDVVALGKAALMPVIWMAEATDWPIEESSFRYRLVGQDLVQDFRRNPSRAMLADVHDPEMTAFLHRRYRTVMGQALAEYRSGRILQADDKTFLGHRLLLPLADDNDRCVFAIGCMWKVDAVYHLTGSKRPTVSKNDIIAVPIDQLPL